MIERLSDAQLLAFGKAQQPNWDDEDFTAWVQSKRQVSTLALAGLKYSDWQARVKEIHCPALLIHADDSRDGILTPTVVDAVLASNTCFSAEAIKNAGHNIRRDQFEAYILALRRFL